MFFIIQPLFLTKTTNIYLGLGFEFGPQRIRALALCVRSLLNWVMNAYIVRVPFGVGFNSMVESDPNWTVSPLSAE